MITKVSKIEFLTSKGGHTTAIVNGEYSVVRNLDKQPIYTVYKNRANGFKIDSTIDLIIEFSEAFLEHFELQEKRHQEEIEAQRLEDERETKHLTNLTTPQDFAFSYDLRVVETASNWNDLYTGRSSFAILINSHEEYRLVQKIALLNNWDGEFGETKNRAGEHHSTFSGVYDLEDYQSNVQNYFDDKYFYKDQETEREFYLSELKDRLESEEWDLEEAKDWLKDWETLEAGYYQNGEYLVYEGSDFTDFFGYNHDVYTYNFAYSLPDKRSFYDGFEQPFNLKEL